MEKFIALIDKYENFGTLTNTMLNGFVEKSLSMNAPAKAVRTPRGRLKSTSTITVQRRTNMNELTYTRCGDYYIPDLKLSEKLDGPCAGWG